MPDPSLSPLPPEWVGAIRDVLMDSGHEHRTEAVVEAVAPLLDAILVARDERWQHQLATKVSEHQECCRDRSRLETEARRLREALEWYGDPGAYEIRDGVDRHYRDVQGVYREMQEDAPILCDGGSIARAALSASPVSEAAASDSSTTNEVAKSEVDIRPVSVPEQEEGRADEALFCPDGHLVVPARLSVAEGLFYCDGCRKGPKAYYSRGDLAAAPSSSPTRSALSWTDRRRRDAP